MNVAVAVVGSANLDVVIRTPVRPRGGETVMGTRVDEAPGGKGLNQALAAVRFAATAFVGAVGDDEAGRTLQSALAAAGVDISGVQRIRGDSGRAYITVTPDAENSIVVLPLANGEIAPDAVRQALDSLVPRAVLAQCEVPQDAVSAAAAWCAERGARFALNLSPVRAVPPSLLRGCDPLIVNVGEAQAVLGDVEPDATTLARRLAERARSVVVTAGGRGAVVVSDGVVSSVEATPVVAVDTTGAGDAFAGALVAQLAASESLPEAARRASAEAARVIQLTRADR